jgi:hypothetical protein
VSCPNCHKKWDDEVTTCPVCGIDLDRSDPNEWVVLGEIDNKLAADFARETLKSYEIPAVILSRSGFFGDVGLTLTPFYNAGLSGAFEVSVPVEFVEEATDILDMTVGDAWRRKEN